MLVGDCLFANFDVLAVRIKSRFFFLFFLLLWSVTNHGRNILDQIGLKIIDEIYFEMLYIIYVL